MSPTVDPDAARVIAWLADEGLTFDPAIAVQVVRDRLEAMVPDDLDLRHPQTSATEIDIEGRSARLVIPTGCEDGLIVWLHGGGWCFGSPRVAESLARRIARATRRRVLVPEYRLAPEHPFPRAVLDAQATWCWVRESSAGRRLGSGPVVLGGDSAGANLAAVVATTRPSTQGPDGLALVCPFVDADIDEATAVEYTDDPFLPTAALRQLLALYASGVDPTDPRLSPARALVDSGFPSTLVVTAEVDVLAGQGNAFARRLAAAGVGVEHHQATGMFHGFFGLDDLVPTAGRTFAAVAAWLRGRF